MADADQGPDEQTTQSMEGPRGAPIQGPSVRAGDAVGPYEIVEEIGRGGMGVVYRARHRRLGNDVALKCPYPRLASDPANRKRFLREARAYSRLSGPNIVHVFDTFEHAGLPWLALQLVEGPSLEELLETHGKIDPRTALSYAEDIANALDLAHRHGVLHRDIKPRNVLITQDDRVLLTDFGLARFIPSEEHGLPDTTQSSLTETGAIVGTPRYMAPEQALGKTIDPRTDIYSWGAVVYEMLTGEPLFKKRKLGSLIDQIMHHEPEPISRFTYEVPEEFERIIRKAIAKDPRDRFQSTADLLVDLRTLRRRMDGSSTATAPSPRPRRLRTVLWLGAGIAGIVAIAALWNVRQRSDDGRPLPAAVPFQATTSDAWQGQPSLSPDGSRIAFTSDESGSDDIYVVSVRGGDPIRLTDHPGEDSHPAWFPDGSRLAFTSSRSGSASVWTVGQFGGSAVELVPNAAQPAVSHDGSRIAFVRTDPASNELRVHVASIAGVDAARRVSSDESGLWSHEHPTWSPDDRRLCYSSRHGLWTVDLTSDTCRRITFDDGYDSDPVWSPSGFIYFSSDRDATVATRFALWRVRESGSRSPQRVSSGSASEQNPSLSADGRVLAYASGSPRRHVVSWDRSTDVRDTIPTTHEDYQVAMSRDGDVMAFVSARDAMPANLWVQRLHEGRRSGSLTRVTRHESRVSYPSFSPDGRFLAYYVIQDGNRDIWCAPVDGGQPVRLTEDPAADIHPSWAADGSSIVFASERDGDSAVWSLDMRGGHGHGPPRKVASGDFDCLAPVVSPDGRQVAFVGYTGSGTDLWIAPVSGDGEPRRVTTNADVQLVRWAADGLWVSGTWSSETLVVRRLELRKGTWHATDPVLRLGPSALPSMFDVSGDGRNVVFTHVRRVGNVWVSTSTSGVY